MGARTRRERKRLDKIWSEGEQEISDQMLLRHGEKGFNTNRERERTVGTERLRKYHRGEMSKRKIDKSITRT